MVALLITYELHFLVLARLAFCKTRSLSQDLLYYKLQTVAQLLYWL